MHCSPCSARDFRRARRVRDYISKNIPIVRAVPLLSGSGSALFRKTGDRAFWHPGRALFTKQPPLCPELNSPRVNYAPPARRCPSAADACAPIATAWKPLGRIVADLSKNIYCAPFTSACTAARIATPVSTPSLMTPPHLLRPASRRPEGNTSTRWALCGRMGHSL